MRIRSHLLLFAFGVILPVAAFSVFLTTLLVDREQRTFAAGAIERLRSTMSAVDAQVQGQITALNALARGSSWRRPRCDKKGAPRTPTCPASNKQAPDS